jgi:hypothetical protein
MNRVLAIALMALAVVLIAISTIIPTTAAKSDTPAGAVSALFNAAKDHNYDRAYSFVAPTSNVDKGEFIRELAGRDGSLRTYSTLQNVDAKVLQESNDNATVRANLEWSTAVGAIYDTRDLKLAKNDGDWKIVWPVEKQPNLPPQVIAVNDLRWYILHANGGEDWGAQNVEAPKVRIVSMNATERDGNVIILGEVVNEDTVPAFVSVNATLLDTNGAELGEESSFDKTSHTLLPKEVSPFRIDFTKMKLSQVKSVRMQPQSLLVPASADPVVAVLHQRIEEDERGHHVLRGELMNQSGQTVNIPHVLATYYDASGKVIWVSDGYVDQALLPQVPVPFAVSLRDDLAGDVHTERVTVNNYVLNQD